MAVVNTKSASVTNADAAPQVLNDLQIAGGKVKCLRAVVEQGASDNDGSVFRLARIHSSWLVKSVRKFHDAITGGISYDLGLYRTAGDGGAVVDADAYASAVSLASADAAGVQIAFEARDVANIEKKVWQDAGLSSDPNLWYDLALTGNTVGSTGGTIGLDIEMVMPGN
jgi:hypothetical protein